MREHKDAAVRMRYVGNISAFLAFPSLGIVSSFLIFIKPLMNHLNSKSIFPCGIIFF